jgi:excinuclease ABC subunit A
VEQIVDQVMALPERTRIQVLSPVVRGRKGEHRKLLEEIRKDGFVRVKVDGAIVELSSEINLDKNKKHDIAIVVDRIAVRNDIEGRLSDSVQTALNRAGGLVVPSMSSTVRSWFSARSLPV